MSPTRATFATCDLRPGKMPKNGVYGLSDGLLPRMAHAFNFGLGQSPTEEALRAFIGKVGKSKFLLDNLAAVREALGTDDDVRAITDGWVEASGLLVPLDRSFMRPDLRSPDDADIFIITGAVVRWQLDRLRELIRRLAHRQRATEVLLVAGNRPMKVGEDLLIAAYEATRGEVPTEAAFMEGVLLPMLRFAGVNARFVPVDSGQGSVVMAEAAAEAGLARPGCTVVVIGNQPAGLMLGGQLRTACRGLIPGFDDDGDQLFVAASDKGLALDDEVPETVLGLPEVDQNSETALGVITRTALTVHQNLAVAA